MAIIGGTYAYGLDREGFKYFFYSNEHMPEHVHVKNGSGKARFDISDGVQLVESKGMKLRN